MEGSNPNNNPRIIVIQKLYGYYLNKSSNIEIQKHRYKTRHKKYGKNMTTQKTP